jgi:ATP-dependent helicase/nuclease subunit B
MEDDRLKEMRLLGLVNRDEAVLRRMSRDLTKADRYVPVRIKKDGTPSSRPKTASTGDFLEMTEKTRFRMSRIGEAIYSGQIAPYPARIKGKAECQLCPYRETCPFDSRIDFYHEVK